MLVLSVHPDPPQPLVRPPTLSSGAGAQPSKDAAATFASAKSAKSPHPSNILTTQSHRLAVVDLIVSSNRGIKP